MIKDLFMAEQKESQQAESIRLLRLTLSIIKID